MSLTLFLLVLRAMFDAFIAIATSRTVAIELARSFVAMP